MQSRRNLYGLMGLLSLLGLIGIFTPAKSFLAFFAFVVDFFIQSDEMMEEYMNKLTSRAFYCGMVSVAIVTCVCFFSGWKEENQALITGLAVGWAVSIAVYALSAAYYGFKEKWGLDNDKE